MIRIMLILLTAVSGIGIAGAENLINLTSVSGHPGDEVTVSMSMSGTDRVSAIDMKLPLPPELTYVEGSASLTDRCGAHNVSASTVEGTLRLVVYTLSLKEISGTEGEVLSFKLKLGNKPLTTQLKPVVILGNSEGGKVPATVNAGALTILCPELTIDSPQIDFGHIPIRSSYNGVLTLRNTGNEPLTILSLTADSPLITVTDNGTPIAPGETRRCDVRFSPVERGAFTSKITVDCNAINRLVYNRLQTAEVVADPYSVNELHVERAQGASGTAVTVNLRMNNMEPIAGVQAVIRLPEGIDYAEGSAKLTERATDHEIVATLQGRDLTLLAYSPSNQAFKAEDGVVATFDVELNTRSGWYYLKPAKVKLANAGAENMTSAVSGEYVVIKSPTIYGAESLDFGEQDVTAAMTARYRVENRGEVPLIVERVTFLAEGYSVLTPLPLTVQPRQSAELEVAYRTELPGEFGTTMNIYNNDPDMRMKTVTLSGKSYSPNSLSVSGSYDRQEGYTLSVELDNHAKITAIQFDLVVDNPAAIADGLSVTPTARLEGYSTVASKIADGHFRIIAYVIGDRTIAGNSGEVMSVHLPKGAVTPDALRVTLEKMVLSSADSKNLLSPQATASCEIETFERGDANADRRLTISDATTIVNYLNGTPPGRFSSFGADANANGRITIGDATTVVNVILY